MSGPVRVRTRAGVLDVRLSRPTGQAITLDGCARQTTRDAARPGPARGSTRTARRPSPRRLLGGGRGGEPGNALTTTYGVVLPDESVARLVFQGPIGTEVGVPLPPA